RRRLDDAGERVRRGLLRRHTLLELAPKLGLALGLLGLQLLDLPLDRGEKRPAGRELALDRRARGGALAHERDGLGLCALQPGLARLDEVVERDDFAQNLAVLRRDPVDGVEAVDEIVEARGAEDDLDRV